jgi:predicted  nucleic acid-binding Zn-ribbon protein
VEQDLAAARSEIVRLRDQLRTKQTALGGLEMLVKQRLETIDRLNHKLEQARAANQRLEQECGYLADMIRIMPQLDPAMLAPK